jgi:hypothetical protein
VLIRLELEAAPRVIVDTVYEGEEDRLRDWFEAHPEQLELIQRAQELAAIERAA